MKRRQKMLDGLHAGPTGGSGPSGSHLFVANQGSDDVQVFRIAIDDGSLTLEESIATGVSPERIVVTGTFGD